MRSYLLPLLAAGALLAGAAVHAASSPARELMTAGDALDKQLKTSDALSLYLQAEKAAPTDAEILRRIAKSNAELMVDTDNKAKKKELGLKAVDYAKRAVAADPQNALAHLSLAICYGRVASLLDNQTKIDNSRLVKQEAEKSIALDASNDYTYHVLGAWNYELAGLNIVLRAVAKVVYGGIPNASYEDAVKFFQKAIELAPQRVAHHVELGRTYAAMGKTDLARASLERGLALPNREKDDPVTKERGRAALQKL